jgi:hypothetical protein
MTKFIKKIKSLFKPTKTIVIASYNSFNKQNADYIIENGQSWGSFLKYIGKELKCKNLFLIFLSGKYFF